MKNKNIVFYRFFADIIDIYFITLILLIFDYLISQMTINNNYISLLGYILIVCKDFYNKKGSLGKRIMKIELSFYNNRFVVAKKLIRNTFVIIWPIEVVVLLIFKKRIGDYVTNSKIIRSRSRPNLSPGNNKKEDKKQLK